MDLEGFREIGNDLYHRLHLPTYPVAIKFIKSEDEIPKEAIVEGNDITSVHDDPNHFAPEYFGKGKRWHLPRVERMEQGFAKARKHFERNKRSVFNATAGGHLEVFERRQFEKLF